MSKDLRSVIVTGASGLLGRAVLKKFQEAGWQSTGLAFSRAHKDPNFVRIDVRDAAAVKQLIETRKPTAIIHCAAERNPEAAEKQPGETEKLNVDVTRNFADYAAHNGSFFIYISTDSVFDGKSPPYKEDAATNPVNKYGQTKLGGETVTLASSGVVLRVPFLYGPVDEISESSVTGLLGQVLDFGKEVVISDYDKRCPTHVDDIAAVLLLLADKKAAGENIFGIYHWSGVDKFTKYETAVAIAKLFNLPFSHITPDQNAPTSGAARAYDPALSCERLQKLGAAKPVSFLEGIVPVLKPFLPTK